MDDGLGALLLNDGITVEEDGVGSIGIGDCAEEEIGRGEEDADGGWESGIGAAPPLLRDPDTLLFDLLVLGIDVRLSRVNSGDDDDDVLGEVLFLGFGGAPPGGR